MHVNTVRKLTTIKQKEVDNNQAKSRTEKESLLAKLKAPHGYL